MLDADLGASLVFQTLPPPTLLKNEDDESHLVGQALATGLGFLICKMV